MFPRKLEPVATSGGGSGAMVHCAGERCFGSRDSFVTDLRQQGDQAVVGLMAFPVRGGTTELGTIWEEAPLMGIVAALDPHLPEWLHVPLRVYVGLSGAFILLLAAATSISGFGRLAYSLGEHGQLPRAFGRLHRRTLVSPEAVLASVVLSVAIIISTSAMDNPFAFLASLFSFGVLLAFTAAQLAVIQLRRTDPDRRRPFKVPLNVRVRGVEVPIPSVVGATATFAIWIVALATHPAARYAGPAWLAAGLVVYLLVRRERGAGLLEHVTSTDEQVVPEATFKSILVPMKLGQIGEEMVATAVKLAQEHGARIDALHVIKVPLDLPLDAPMQGDEASAAESIRSEERGRGPRSVEVRGSFEREADDAGRRTDRARRRRELLALLGKRLVDDHAHLLAGSDAGCRQHVQAPVSRLVHLTIVGRR
jgi:APA family basic amino acid/polyamine antiporter